MQSHRGCTPGIAQAQEEPFPGHKSLYFKTYFGLSKKLQAKSTLGKGYTVDFVDILQCLTHETVGLVMISDAVREIFNVSNIL